MTHQADAPAPQAHKRAAAPPVAAPPDTAFATAAQPDLLGPDALLQRAAGNAALARRAPHASPGADRSLGSILRRLRDPHPAPLHPHLAPDSRLASRIQRHNIRPAPEDLLTPPPTQAKQQWSVMGGVNPQITALEFTNIQGAIAGIIPPGAVPNGAARAATLTYTTVDAAHMPPGYQQMAAKADPTGQIYFNWEHNDYFKRNGEVDPLKVKSTVVHESLHAVSANHTGFQDYADLLSPQNVPTVPQLQPDEAITDLLAVQVYATVFGGGAEYVTGYWTPANANAFAYAEGAKKQLATAQRLPSSWTGEMVDVLTNVLGLSQPQLFDMYFTNPDAFGAALGAPNPGGAINPAIKTRIIKEWSNQMGATTLEEHEVLSADYKEQAMTDAIDLKFARKLLDAQGDPARILVVREALAAKKVPEQTRPGATAPQDITYADSYISGQGRLNALVAHATTLVNNAAVVGAPTLTMPFPREQEQINAGTNDYAVRMECSPDVNNVRVKINEGGFQQARRTPEAWWYDLHLPDFGQGPLSIVAEAWTAAGLRVEVNRTVRYGAKPPLEGPALDVGMVRKHLRTLGIENSPVKIIVVPYSKPGANPAVKFTYKLNTPLSEYPARNLFGVPASDLNQTLLGLLSLPANDAARPAAEYINTGFSGGGYEARHKLVVLASDHLSERTLLHELGHYKQDLEGAEETNSYVIILEYHNVLTNENLDPSKQRVSYGDVVPPNAANRTWADLLADIADLPETVRLVNEIENALARPEYTAVAPHIRANLVAEYFADVKQDRAHKKAAMPAPVVGAPTIAIDHPTELEVLNAPDYAIRMAASANTDNVRVKVNTRGWQNARQGGGYWWYDVKLSDYPKGRVTIMAEAWTPAGARAAATRTITWA